MSKQVTVPWTDIKNLSFPQVARTWSTCKRSDKAHCINSQFVRIYASVLGREVRYVHTFKGALHWSECINGQWGQYVAPLLPKYAAKIDAFDHEGKHFAPPKQCPMGAVRFVGFCVERHDSPDIVKGRKKTMNGRIEEGKLVPGQKFRERQLPYVQAQV